MEEVNEININEQNSKCSRRKNIYTSERGNTLGSRPNNVQYDHDENNNEDEMYGDQQETT